LFIFIVSYLTYVGVGPNNAVANGDGCADPNQLIVRHDLDSLCHFDTLFTCNRFSE
jgi:hypothetical protein